MHSGSEYTPADGALPTPFQLSSSTERIRRRGRPRDNNTFSLDPRVKWCHAALRTTASRDSGAVCSTYDASDVEAEFRRFAYLEDYKLFALTCLGVGTAYAITAVTSLVGTSVQLDAYDPSVVVFFVVACIFFVNAVVGLTMGWLHSTGFYGRGVAGDHRMITWYYRLQLGHWLCVGFLAFGILSFTGRPCFEDSPRFAPSSAICERALRSGPEAVLVGTAVFIREPRRAIAMLTFDVVSQLLIFARQTPWSLSAWVFVTALSIVTAVCCGCAVVWRDRATRDHFAAIAATIASHHEVDLQRQELALIVQYAVPRGLLARVLESVSTSPSLLTESSPRCLVCMTSAVAFGRFATARLLRDTIIVLHDIFTAFDAATSDFNVEKATVYGDVYCVSSGLSGAPNLTGIVGFTHWQVNRFPNMKLRSVITFGAATGSLMGEGALAYSFRGPAVEAAAKALVAVPAKQVWISDETVASLPINVAVAPTFPLYPGFLLLRLDDGPITPLLQSSDPPSVDAAQRLLGLASQSTVNPFRVVDDDGDDDDDDDEFDDVDATNIVMSTATPASGVALKRPATVTISVVLRWRGIFAWASDEHDYQAQARRTVLTAAPYIFTFGFLLSSSVLLVAGAERVFDPSFAFATSPSVDVAFFALHSLLCLIMLCLGPLHVVLQCSRQHGSTTSTTNESTVSLPSVPVSPCRASPLDWVHTSDRRVVAVWLTFVSLAMWSLLLLQRSVVTDGPHFLFMYGVITSAVVLRPQPWIVAAAVAWLVCIIPMGVLCWYHIGVAITPLYGTFIRGCLVVLAAQAGPQTGRRVFAVLKQAQVSLDTVKENADTIRRVVQRQMPPHVSTRGLATLRAAVADNPFRRNSSIMVDEPDAPVIADFCSDFACVTIRFSALRSSEARAEAHSVYVAERVESILAQMGEEACLSFLQSLGDEVMVGGPFTKPCDANLERAVLSAAQLLSSLTRDFPHRGFVAAGAVEEGMGAIVGARSVRYRMYGVAIQHSQALLSAGLGCVMDAVVAPSHTTVRLLVCTRRFHGTLQQSNASSGVDALIARASFRQIWRLRDVGAVEVHGVVI